MKFGCSHLVLNVTDIAKTREFYVDKLGLEVLEDFGNLLALRVGSIRISIFLGGKAETHSNLKLVLRTDDLDAAVERLAALGLDPADASEAPGFMRFTDVVDPDGNVVIVAQYLRDPLEAAAATA